VSESPVPEARRRAGTLPVAVAALALVLLLLAVSFREEASPDTYFHLAVGRRIAAEWRLPRTNEFLAFEQDHAFVAHEWLFQVVAWEVFRAGGAELLALAKTAIVVLAFVVLYIGISPGGRVSALGALLLSILLAEPRFLARPEVVSLLGLALTIAVLERDRRKPDRRHLVVLGLFQIVWVNCHGFALLGPAVGAIYLIAALAGRALGPRASCLGLDASDVRPARAATFLGVQLAASFVNPFFHEGALYPILIVLRASKDWSSGGLYMRIVELQSPFTAALADVFEVKVLKLMIALAVLGAAVSLRRRRARLEHLLAAALLTATAWNYLRNVPFAALGLVLPIAQGAASLGELLAARASRRVRSGAAAAIAVVALVSGRAALANELHENASYDARAGLGFSDFLRYDEAVSFLERSPPRGNYFNNFGAGHFLIFARDRTKPLPYICGNTELYPGSFLVQYHEIVRGDVPFAPAFEKAGITDALLDHRVEVSRELILAMARDPAWRLVHLDSHCLLFRKVDAATPPAVDLAAVASRFTATDEGEDRFALTRALRAIGLLPAWRAAPLERLHMACILDTLGRPDDGLALARAAYALRPDWPPSLYVLCGLERRVDPKAAEAHALELARLLPGAPYPHVSAGLAALQCSDPGRAVRAVHHFEDALEVDPGFALAQEDLMDAYVREDPPDLVGLKRGLASPLLSDASRAYYEGQIADFEGRADRAEDAYRRAATLRPSLTWAHYYLGKYLFRRGAFAEARAEYERVLAAVGDGEAWYNVGMARLAAGDRPAGKAALEQAALLRPKDPQVLVALGTAALEDGDRPAARRWAEAARRLDPTSVQVRQLESDLEGGDR
jgi:tetratricopeptide (TPR) repeat protein